MGEQLSTNPTPDSILENSENIMTNNTDDNVTNSSGGVVEDIQKTQSDAVPLAKFLELKNSLKDAKARLADYEDSKYSEELKAKKARVRDTWIDKGFDELTADAISEEIANIYEELGKAKKTHGEMLLIEQIDELSNDTFYSDIKQYEPQIKSKINQFAKAGEKLSLEDAYLLVTGPKTKLREAKVHQEVRDSLTAGTGGTNVPTSAGSRPANTYNLDAHDMKALSKLKEYQPSAGWDEKKYFETMIKDRS